MMGGYEVPTFAPKTELPPGDIYACNVLRLRAALVVALPSRSARSDANLVGSCATS